MSSGPFQTRNMEGALFRKEDKDNESQPDYTGKCVINGEDYFISAWINTSRSNKKYMKLKFSEPRVNEQPRSPVRPLNQELDDDIPF
jgi:uncharacterized protein (DUF736 family)